jgi:hypothetical protein
MKKMPAKPIPSILLVDGHEMERQALHNKLEEKGYNMLEAQNMEEALVIAGMFPGKDPRPGDQSGLSAEERSRIRTANSTVAARNAGDHNVRWFPG